MPGKQLNTLTFNISNVAIRHETLQGRKYLVAPMAMLTEGVHSGSGGPLLYTEDECKKPVAAWNMKPVVVYHPEINGSGVSACDPDILERQQVGMVMNTRWEGKLRAEAWIEEARAELVDNRVLAALEANKMMEVSTGVFVTNAGEPGEWNGTAYNAKATEHIPDHLALLPDKVGACSIADGAGLLQLNEAAQASGFDATHLMAREMDLMRRMVGNAMSHSNIFSALTRAVRAKLGLTKDVWIVDVYADFCIYDSEKDKKLFRLDYTLEDAEVKITGEPVEVVRVTEYRTTQGGFVGNYESQTQETGSMNKDQIVDSLIANTATQWGAGDRETLMQMDESALAKMSPVINADPAPESPEPKAESDDLESAEEVPVTLEAYVAAAPPEIAEILLNGVTAHNKAKDALIAQIIANKANPFSKEFLQTKMLDELQGLATLSGSSTSSKEQTIPMFNGAATLPGAPVVNASAADEEPLLPPTMNFGETD